MTMAKTNILEILAPEEKAPTYDTVREKLHTAILSNELPAGTRLVQSALAKQLNVSITPVREAIRDLTAEGFIDLDPFRGAIVHTPTLDEVEYIYAIRSQLLPLSTRLGIQHITDETLAKARELADQIEAADSQVEWVEANRAFHVTLDTAHPNKPLSDILGRLANLSELYVNIRLGVRIGRREKAEEDHRALINAYADRDIERAIEVGRLHLQRTLDAVHASYEGES